MAQTWSRPGGPTTHAATYQVKSSKLGARIKITLAVRDFVGRTGTLARTFVVKDTLGPDVTIKTKGSKVQRLVTISGKVSDPSGIKKTVTVRFGDGKSKTVKVKRGRYSVKHTYKSKKAFTIAVSAKDKRGHSSRTTKVLTIK